jgi:threonine dehydrogenase-like Zn-dependent dehydrogenase
MSQHWFEVQRHLEQVYVTRQSGGQPQLHNQQALVKIVSAGICGSDIRVTHGDKIISGNPRHYIIPGHEGVGRIVAVSNDEEELKQGDYVVVLPHVHKNTPCSASQINPTCIGRGHTLHRGWDLDGCFADFIVVPTVSLKRIDAEHLHLAEERAPELSEAIFAFVEPMLCVISAYALLAEQSKTLLGRELVPGRALVIGSGPIGVLHGLALLRRGYTVEFLDTLRKRAELARWCLRDRSSVFDEEHSKGDFDLVMVTASSADAIRKAESMVRDGGIVYLFAGLNTIDRTVMGSVNVFSYESLHRSTRGMITVTPLIHGDKTIFYLGHSGYYEHLATEAIAVVAEQAGELSRAITGIIPGWSSPCIESRLPGGVNWEAEDGSPAIISVLHGTDLRNRHCKLLIRPR